jgi:8-oxo-dGTP diphosphatase
MSSEKIRKLVTVVCACIRRNGGQEVLLAMRHAPGVVGLDGKWELPGGKVEFGETPDKALVREIHEEIGIDISPLRLLPYLHTNIWEYEHAWQHVILAGYECDAKNADQLASGEEVRWFDVGAIDFRNTLPGTKEFIQLAIKNEWFDRLRIEFEYVDQTMKSVKYFGVSAQPTLFSNYGLVRYSSGGRRHARFVREQFQSPREMDARIFEIVKARVADGYRITGLEGAVERYHVLEKIVMFARQRQALGSDVLVN